MVSHAKASTATFLKLDGNIGFSPPRARVNLHLMHELIVTETQTKSDKRRMYAVKVFGPAARAGAHHMHHYGVVGKDSVSV